MTGYLISFLVYTSAMIGVIFLALFVFKTFSNKCFSKKSSLLHIEDSINLSPRKTLYVIKVENEKFLIASDVERTTMISKLESHSTIPESGLTMEREDKSLNLKSFDGLESMSEFASLMDFKERKESMMKGLARKLGSV